MKITKLFAENVKRLQAVEITPGGDVVVLAGDNGAGKSSVLDAIAMTLGGKELVCSKPVRSGQDRAKSVVELSNGLVVTRTYTAGGTTSLKVEAKDGARYGSPQSMMDAIVGKLSFDPLAFTRLKPIEQKQALQKLVGLDFSKLDAYHAGIFTQRTEVNREIARLESVLQSRPVHEVPAELVSMDELNREMEEAAKNNKRRSERVNEEEKAEGNVVLQERNMMNCADAVERAQRMLEDAQRALEGAKDAHKNARNAMDRSLEELRRIKDLPVPPAVDTQKIVSKMTEVASTNAKIKEAQERRALEEQLKVAKGDAEAFTSQLQAIAEDKQAHLKAAKFPVDGLSFTEDGVMYNGVPFQQCSTGEQIRVSVAVGMAMNPQLKVLLCRDGSLLDAKSLKAITEQAKENGYQLWIETCRPDAGPCVVIEDGRVI